MDLGGWLRSLGLDQYEGAFRDNAIDSAVLPNLTAEDLKDLGISVVGHRRKLLDAIAALREDTNAKASSPGASPGIENASQDAGERRQVTVMFSDLVGSTALATRMDPEDLREVIAAYQKCVAETVGRFGGFVAKYLGDGVLVYFGYPHAHEDDAERAVRAGLELIATVSALKTRAALQTRVGIATGAVVVGDVIGSGSAQERGIVGEAPNLAARIHAAADPDTVVVSESTWRLAGRAFEYDDLGAREFKGISGTVRLRRATGESAARGRFDARLVKGLTPLIGRNEELALMRQRWDFAKEGDGQLVLLSAPAGVGKSRLMQAFHESLGEAPTCLQLFGSPFHTNSAFYPFIRSLEWAAAITRTDTPARKLEKLEAILQDSKDGESDAVPLMATLLSIPFEERYAALQINEQVQKQRTMELFEHQLVALAKRGPVLILCEDAHWIDATSLELLGRIIRLAADLPVLIIVNHRPEFSPPWSGLGHVTMLRLNHLGRRQAVDLVKSLARDKPLPEAIVEQIVIKAQGIPLFVEEITRSVLESEHVPRQPADDIAIPPTLQQSLIARLDRLGPAKDVAFTASAIGREFSYELIRAVWQGSPAMLQTALELLVQSELLWQRGVPPEARYTFKHALIQDAAYQSILKAKRRELHQRIADTTVSLLPEIAETEPELLAHHYSEANALSPALTHWRRAGERAVARLAYIEALGHTTRAKTLIETLPAGQERDEWELTFLVIEGPSRMALEGWDSPAAKLLYDEARTVAERLGRPAEVFRSIWGLWMGAHGSGRHDKAREHLGEIFRLLRDTSAPEYVVQAHHAGGSQMLAEGKPTLALTHVEKLLASYRADTHGNLALVYGAHDPRCCSLGMRALSLMMLGHLDQAEAASTSALNLSQQLGHKPSVAHCQLFRAELFIILNKLEEAEPHLRTCIQLSKKYSLAGYLFPAELKEGLARVVRGDTEAGVRQADTALQSLRSIPSRRFHLPIRIAIVGRAKAAAGDVEGALALFDSALEAASTYGERWYEPELLRLRAEMLLAKGGQNSQAAEQCLQAAIAMAQTQQARFWELRAATALAELWRRDSRAAQARDILAPVYAGFNEGLDTPDLRHAKALLDLLVH